jgi:hypothetical protein
MAALVSSASIAAPSPWKNPLKIKAGEPAPYLRKERGKAQWKTERKGRK